MTGKFIAIEGGDANGKNTQSKLLAEKLDALLISFPRYETPIGQMIKAHLNERWSVQPVAGMSYMDFQCADAVVRQALFTLDRYDAASEITRALDSGKCVVVDRYWLSGLMYGASDLVDAKMLERVHQCLPQPDVWVLLDVSVEESFRRRPERQDVYERDREKCEGVRWNYIKQFQKRAAFVHKGTCLVHEKDKLGLPRAGCTCDVRKWVVVNGVGTIEEVHNRILGVI